MWPPDHVVDHLATLPHDDSSGVRWVAPENVHATLRFLGEADVDEARAALDDVVLPPTTAIIGPGVRRLGRDAIVVPVDGLGDLAAVVIGATAAVGRRPEHRPFRGHLTIARLRPGGRCALVGRPIAATFPVGEVALVQSALHPTGARYETIARCPVSRG